MSSSLRPVAPDDEVFLFEVYASTRAEEMAVVPWNAEQKHAFLAMQFEAQTHSYQEQFPRADYNIILQDDVPVGRLIVDRGADRILLIDIALLAEHRNRGIGSKFITDLKSEAQKTGKPIRLHVENFNPAYRLYERLGFAKTDEEGFYSRLEWQPEAGNGGAG